MERPLVVYFKNTVAEKVALNLSNIATLKGLESNRSIIESFVQNLDPKKYPFIIGLGEYSGRDKDKLRIETICTSKWRNHSIKTEKKHYIKPLFTETVLLKHANRHGNSYCNLLSYLIVNLHEDVTYNFIHIPKTMNIAVASEEITKELKNFKTVYKRLTCV